MGKNEKILGEISLNEISDYEPTKHAIEWTDAFHLHWRNLVFYMNKVEFEQFMSGAMFALQKWNQLGCPDIRKDDMNIGLAGMGGLSFKHGMHSTYCAIEQLRENHFHFNYRSLRIDLSRKELLELCDMFEQTKKNLLEGTGKDVNKMTTDEYFKSKNQTTKKDEVERFFKQISDVDYVVMRWYETLPESFHPVHDDVDILVMDDQKHLIPYTSFCEENDRRVISDNYFPPDKAKEMIETSVRYNGIKVPIYKMYFLSMAYHIVYHKFLDGGVPTNIEPFATVYKQRGINRYPEYLEMIEKMAQHFGYEEEITLEYLHSILQKEGWKPCFNAPSGVIHDVSLLKEFINMVSV